MNIIRYYSVIWLYNIIYISFVLANIYKKTVFVHINTYIYYKFTFMLEEIYDMIIKVDKIKLFKEVTKYEKNSCFYVMHYGSTSFNSKDASFGS
jgi:hypothetical protein